MKAIIVVFMLTVSATALAENKEICTDKTIQLVETLLKVGPLMKIDKSTGNVQVTKDWYSTPVDSKKMVAKVLAQCFSPHGTVRISDGFSGKDLAKYTPFGFTSYE
jgi:hypothetical protein